MMRLLLNAHPDVAVPPESRFIVELYEDRDPVDVDRFLERLSAHHQFRAWNLPIEEVAALLPRGNVPYARAVDAAYEAYARRRGKTVWGDKTPRYIERIDLLDRLFPQARFVHVVRDGRNVALSYAGVPFGPKTAARAAQLWARRVRAGLTWGRALGPARYLEVRYEDLVEDPDALERQARRLCDFLQLPFDDSMLHYTEVARGELLDKADRLNPLLTKRPSGEARSWKANMPSRQIEVFESVAGDVLSALGYERSYPSPGPRARIEAAVALRGVPLGRLPKTPRSPMASP